MTKLHKWITDPENTWLISDTHFGHNNIIVKYGRKFDNIDQHDKTIMNNWREVVKPTDTIIHLGDICFGKCLYYLDVLPGKKYLIQGNHDQASIHTYLNYFQDVSSSIKIRHNGGNIFLCHFPLHPNELDYRVIGMIHGHMHGKVLDDKRYVNVSLEQTDYKPIKLTEVLKRFDTTY